MKKSGESILASKNEIDMIHCHDWITALYVYISTRGLKTIKIVTIHSQARSWQNNLTHFLLNRFDKIITVSRGQKLDFFEKGIPWSKIEVVYNCFDTNRFELFDNKKHKNSDDAFKMIMVGNFYWQKDHKTLIEAINIVRNQGFKIELHLVGGRNKELFEQNQRLVQRLNLPSVIAEQYDVPDLCSSSSRYK